MPVREYLCECGYNFEIRMDYHDDGLTTCPICKEDKLHPVFGDTHFYVKPEPTTVGLLSDRNTAKLGVYEKEAREEQMRQHRRTAMNMAGIKEKKNSLTPDLYNKIKKMDATQVQRYIETGET